MARVITTSDVLGFIGYMAGAIFMLGLLLLIWHEAEGSYNSFHLESFSDFLSALWSAVVLLVVCLAGTYFFIMGLLKVTSSKSKKKSKERRNGR
jgi:succinate dehydrogenase hydrophobic anchor subunit